MSSWRELRINQILKKHDEKLFLNKNYKGELQIMREKYVSNTYSFDNRVLTVYEPNHVYIMSLTEDWTSKTAPVDWGLEAISRRLKEIDGWNPDSVISQMRKENEKVDKSKKRDFENKVESFAYEWRDEFKKATSDINTSNLKKLDKRKIKGE